ncbi:MAG: hypothetical protein HY748_06990 [Elusimicrobia bacterium]|nr:hypothetical protein [Elusimicrobiota bacterium]
MRYWVYIDGEVPGSFTPEELSAMADVGPTTLVCPAEGEILEKNWRAAGEFPDIAGILQAREKARPAPGPAAQAEKPEPAVKEDAAKVADGSSDIERFLDTSSNKLFRHVSELMRELDVRRDEHSLVSSLQRQIAELKEALQKTREKTAILEDRMAVVPTLDESVRKNEIHIHGLEEALKKSETAQAELHVKHETCRTELENAKRRLIEAANDLGIRNRLVDKLNKELTEKELALAKALAVIRRFEEEVGRICPETGEIRQAQAPSQPSLPLQPEPVSPALSQPPVTPLSVEPPLAPPIRRVYTTDEPPPAPPAIEPAPKPLQPEAQSALVRFLRKYFSLGQYH